jgi:hypothetical protein
LYQLIVTFVGDAAELNQDANIRLPPVKTPKGKQEITFATTRYDSVTGFTGGSKVYIVYSNNRAYPSYLITYKPN